MKTHAMLLLIAVLFASLANCQIKTPTIDSPFRPGHGVTVASVSDPTVGDGSTPDGVKVDQVFQAIPGKNSDLIPVKAGADNNEPELSVGRKMLSGRKMLDNLVLSGDGVQAGADGTGVTSTLAGHGQTGVFQGKLTDSHIEPHSDETTVTAAGKSISTGAGVNPDQLAGEGKQAVVYTSPGRK